jgi:hypothetical protein
MEIRKLVLFAVLIMFSAGLTGCYTIKVGGNGQQIASSNESGNLIGEKGSGMHYGAWYPFQTTQPTPWLLLLPRK